MSTDYKKKCIIVDDDLQNIAILEHICNEFFSHEIEIINTFSIATEALKFINSEKIDIIFLDIEMPELNGIEFIKAMKHPHPLIVLTTSHPEFALEAYEHNVLDYLVKPIALPRFLNAVAKAQAMFDLLKKYEWQRQGKLILFHESAQVRKFNTLYQDVLKLNAQIEKIKNNNVAVLEKEL
jgi:two-component SAPR family response regulator